MARPFFSGNYGSSLGNTATAAGLIAQAGQAQGQMYAQLGAQISNTIGTTLEKFRQKKKRKEEEERYENVFMGIYENNPSHPLFEGLNIKDIDEAKVVAKDYAKDPKLVEATLKFAKVAEDKKRTDLLMKQIRQSMQSQQNANQLAEQNRMSENQFMQSLMSQTASPRAQRQADIARPGLQALGNGDARNRFMQAQLQQSQNQVPVSSLGSRDFGRFASREGLNPKLSVARMEALRQAELARQPKPMTPQEVANLQQTILENRGLEKDLNTPTSIELTEGEKALDKKFADEMTEFNLPDINKGLDQLTEASDALSKSDTLTGPIVSLMPKFISDRLNPKAAEVREAVEEVVQRNLRLVLGSQFTEKEGERLISRAYNPALDESENKKRVERLIKSIRDAAQEKINMRTYFSKNGTLKGYDFTPVTLESIERNAFSQDGITSNLKPADIQSEIERKKQMLRARQMNAQYFDNPNVPNFGIINSGN